MTLNMRQTFLHRTLAVLVAVAVGFSLAGLSGCSRYVPPPTARVEPTPEPPKTPPVSAAPAVPAEIDSPRFARVAQVANQEIAAGHTPGAVILVGNQGRVVYKRGFGQRTCTPSCRAAERGQYGSRSSCRARTTTSAWPLRRT